MDFWLKTNLHSRKFAQRWCASQKEEERWEYMFELSPLNALTKFTLSLTRLQERETPCLNISLTYMLNLITHVAETSSLSDSGSSQEAPSPSDSSVSLSHPPSMNHLKFSIYNILRDSFGVVSTKSSQHQNHRDHSTSPLSLFSITNFDEINETVADLEHQPALPAWIYCTRYSDRPSAGPRQRKTPKRREPPAEDEKRPRTAFTVEQLERLKQQFHNNRYLTEKRRQELAHELGLNESQIKIWFQNKRAKLKKANMQRAVSTNSNNDTASAANAFQYMGQNLYTRLSLFLK